jgi:hypothetical protein
MKSLSIHYALIWDVIHSFDWSTHMVYAIHLLVT